MTPRLASTSLLLLLLCAGVVPADHVRETPAQCRPQRQAVESAYGTQPVLDPTMSEEARKAAIQAWKATRQITIDTARDALQSCMATHDPKP